MLLFINAVSWVKIKEGLIFKKGEIVRKVPEEKLLDELVKEIEKMD